ncbi:MAG TPA: retropepsin-like aspartic protease [Chthoniobacterales bacterium]|jgi:predicted aspartyl protease|nr:retropepsin-like aspartic protease [Chthoniobacterales bacterium]
MTAATLSLNSSKIGFRLAGGAQPLILLPVQVNDRGPFDFILDTGAGTSLLSTEVAKKLDIKVIGSKEGQSAGGNVSVSLAKVDSLTVAETKVEDVDVGIVDLSHIAKTIGAKIDGDLGYNFLKHFRVTIDYRDSLLRLDDPKRVDSFAHGAMTEIPIRLANPAKPLILVEIHANGRGPFQFAIDTGTSTTAIAPELAQVLGVQTSPVGAGTTGGAPVDFFAGSLQSFQLGRARIDNMAVVVADFFTMLNSAIGAKLDGIVGYNFLRNYKVVIDYPGETLTLL